MNDNGLTTTEFLWHKAVGTNRAIPVACMRQRQRQSAPVRTLRALLSRQLQTVRWYSLVRMSRLSERG